MNIIVCDVKLLSLDEPLWMYCYRWPLLQAWLESRQDHIFLPCIYSFLSLLRTLFVRVCKWRFHTRVNHYQTTNFRLVQTERVCRRQFQIWRKWQKVIQMGRKYCGTRRNCSLQAISPFPTVFSKGLIVWEWVKPFLNNNLVPSRLKEFADGNFIHDENSWKFSKWVENTGGKGEIASNGQFLLFPHCFQRLLLQTC